jgi:hypothetical protein
MTEKNHNIHEENGNRDHGKNENTEDLGSENRKVGNKENREAWSRGNRENPDYENLKTGEQGKKEAGNNRDNKKPEKKTGKPENDLMTKTCTTERENPFRKDAATQSRRWPPFPFWGQWHTVSTVNRKANVPTARRPIYFVSNRISLP